MFIVLSLVFAGYAHSANPKRLKGSLILCVSLLVALNWQDEFLGFVNDSVFGIASTINPRFADNPVYLSEQIAGQLESDNELFEQSQGGVLGSLSFRSWLHEQVYRFFSEGIYIGLPVMV